MFTIRNNNSIEWNGFHRAMTRGGPWNSHWCIPPCDAPNRQDNTVRHVKEALQEICRLVFRGQRASFWCIYVLNPSTLPWAFYIGRTASRDRSRPCRRRKASRLNSSLDSIWCVGWRPWLLGSFLYLCFDQWMINAFGLRPDAPVCSCWPSCFVSFCRMQGSVWFTAESKWAGHQVQRCKTYSFEPVWRRKFLLFLWGSNMKGLSHAQEGHPTDLVSKTVTTSNQQW